MEEVVISDDAAMRKKAISSISQQLMAEALMAADKAAIAAIIKVDENMMNMNMNMDRNDFAVWIEQTALMSAANFAAGWVKYWEDLLATGWPNKINCNGG